MFIATIVDQQGLSPRVIADAARAIGAEAGALVEDVACDLRFAGDPVVARAKLERLFALSGEEGRPSTGSGKPDFVKPVPTPDSVPTPDLAEPVEAFPSSPRSGATESDFVKAVPTPDLAEPVEAFPSSPRSGGIDVIIQRASDRVRKLLVADMDSTMITVECIDELADYVGLKAEVSAVTEAAMRGEIDFAGALAARVALLEGLRVAKAAECLRERVRLMPGAKDLITAFRAAGGYTVLVSGGFTVFADAVGRDIGFDRVVANILLVENGALTGRTAQPIVDAATKRDVLLAELASRGLSAAASLAIGDGANDIPMIEAAGLGIAYHAKPRTEAAADARVRHGDLNVVRLALALS